MASGTANSANRGTALSSWFGTWLIGRRPGQCTVLLDDGIGCEAVAKAIVAGRPIRSARPSGREVWITRRATDDTRGRSRLIARPCGRNAETWAFALTKISSARDYDNSGLAVADSGRSLVGSALRSDSSGAYSIHVRQCIPLSPRARHDPPYDLPRLRQRRQIGTPWRSLRGWPQRGPKQSPQRQVHIASKISQSHLAYACLWNIITSFLLETSRITFPPRSNVYLSSSTWAAPCSSVVRDFTGVKTSVPVVALAFSCS